LEDPDPKHLTNILAVRLKMPEYCKTLFKVQMKLLSLGLVSEAQDAAALTEKSEDSEAGKKAKVT